MKRNLAACTLPGSDRVPYISINTSEDSSHVDITVRGPAMEEIGFGPEATIRMTREQFADLLVQSISRLYAE